MNETSTPPQADDRFFWNKYLQTRLIDLAHTQQPGMDVSCRAEDLVSSGTGLMASHSSFPGVRIRSAGHVWMCVKPRSGCEYVHLRQQLTKKSHAASIVCEVKQPTIRSRDFVFAVLSRRSRYRAGTRYFSRGIDQHGNVSNFNETEQIVLLDHTDSKVGPVRGDIRASYAQIRGSVPIYWAEVNNLRYKPDLVIMDLPATVSVVRVSRPQPQVPELTYALSFRRRLRIVICCHHVSMYSTLAKVDSLRRHFDTLLSNYGDLYLVNLVNQKGYEKPVKEAFERAVQELNDPRIHYTYFDFHHECKGLRFDRVSLLVDRLGSDLQKQG